MAGEPRVLYRKQGHVARITLNRPDVLNAMDLRMHEELAAVWDDFEADDNIWAGVLTGAGTRAFSVGQDLKELVQRVENGEPPSTFGSRGKPGWPRLTERFDLSKPVIARVNGYALGGGFELALACDLIVAAESATFALPEARLGLIAGAGGVFRLARQLPFKTALGHLMTGRRLAADRALALGLVNDVVPAADLDACVEEWVEDLLRCAPLAVRAIKEAATASLSMPLPQAFATRFTWEERRMHSEDALEGPLSFVEKRPPKWTAS
ncbi:enoyl-CoA-hydratase DpgD [Amycolatopsis lurida]